MKLPRSIFSLRSLMLAVLLSGLILGLIAYRLDRDRRRAELQLEIARQFELTDKILGEGEADANTHVARLNLPGAGLKGMGVRGSSSHEKGWFKDLQMAYKDGAGQHQLIRIRMRGDAQDLRMIPIVVEDGGGELNPKILERLLRAYREKGWAYRIVPDGALNKDAP